ncbi:WD-40 repeat protein, partial [Reticulomyxa filosa]
WDIETYKSLHIFNGHADLVWCVDFSPPQINNNYTICSGSLDKTIRIWDIETTKQLILFKGHQHYVRSIKYGSNEKEINTILSGSNDYSVRLWDIRSGQQILLFNGHTNSVMAVEYSPFVIHDNIKNMCYSNVICSGSSDNTIRFWDIRSNKKELSIIKQDDGIYSIQFLQLKRKEKKSKINDHYNNRFPHEKQTFCPNFLKIFITIE